MIFFFYLQWKDSVKNKNCEETQLGPKADYKPQTEDSTEKSKVEVNTDISDICVCLKVTVIVPLKPMNVTKALTCLGLVTGRGMDNGEQV